MRILVVTNLYPPVVLGGYEVECHDVSEHLEADHDVMVLTSDHEVARCPADPRVRRVLPWSSGGRLASFAAPNRAVLGVRAMRSALRDHRPDLLFVWNGSNVPAAALRYAEQAGVPTAYRINEHWFGWLYSADTFTRHLTPGETGPRGIWARGVRAYNRWHPDLRVGFEGQTSASVCWASEFMRTSVVPPPTVRVLHEEVRFPVTRHSSSFERLERRPSVTPIVVFVGRLEEAKGPQIAVRALARLEAEHGIRARLIAAGRGDAGWLTGHAERAGVADRVELTGPLDTAALAEVLGRAGAWVIPSMWEEPSGIVCIEAALARIPAVVSRSGGMPEALADGREALFFDRGDDAACAAALAATFTDRAATERRVAAAFARGRELSIGPHLERMDRFIERAMAAA